MTSYSALELAIEKASNEKCLLFYQEYEDYYGAISYDDFIFYDFVSKDDFLNEFGFFVSRKSDNRSRPDFELHDCVTKDEIYAKLDTWKNIYVKNFDENVDLSLYEEDIMKLYKN